MSSGLFGIVSNGPENRAESLLKKMVESLLCSKRKTSCVHREKGFTWTGFDGESLKWVSDRSIVLALYGIVYDLDSFNDQFEDSERPCHDPSKKLLQLYLREGPESLCGLNGHYVIMIWENDIGKLTLINDRCGFKRFYYCKLPDRLIFASEYKAICVDPDFSNKIDEQALADLMYLGFILKDRTLFEDIKLLPAATVLTYSKGRLSMRKYWDYQFFQPDENKLSEDEYISLFASKLQKAVNKRIARHRKIILPISGGLDSRTMAGMLLKSGFEGSVRTFSHGHGHCYDVRFGGRIAKRLDFKHTFLPFSGDYLEKYSVKYVQLTEGNMSLFSCLYDDMPRLFK